MTTDAERQANAVERIIERGERDEMSDGMSERERLARILYGIGGGKASWGTDNAASDDVKNAYFDADTLMMAGFGDVEAAWDAGAAAGTENTVNWDGWNHRKPEIMNPYSTTMNGAGA